MHTTLTKILATGEQPAPGSTPARGLTARVVEDAERTVVEVLRGHEVVFSVGAFDSPQEVTVCPL